MTTGNRVEERPPKKKSELDCREAGELLGIHAVTARTWAKKGWIPAWRTPTGRFRFNRAEIEQWKREHPAEARESA